MFCCKSPFFIDCVFACYKRKTHNVIQPLICLCHARNNVLFRFDTHGKNCIHLSENNKVSYSISLRCIFSLSIFSIDHALLQGVKSVLYLSVWYKYTIYNTVFIYFEFKVGLRKSLRRDIFKLIFLNIPFK